MRRALLAGNENRSWPPAGLHAIVTAELLIRLIACRYCATLGYAAGVLIAEGKTGLMATASCLDRPCAAWTVGGYPIVDMMCIERRRGK